MLSEKEDKLLHSRQPIFDQWYLGDVIGEGSSGTVYEMIDNQKNRCALKVIPVTVEKENGTISLNRQDCFDGKRYLEEMTDEIFTEVKVMQTLERTTRIVQYKEYGVIKAEDFSMNLILIRMDLLQPLNKVLRTRDSEFSQKRNGSHGH